MLGSRNSSTASWRTRQARDPFVKARVEGNYRSRAALKLLEIEERYKILPKASSSSVVVDLGCAPGGWAQVCSQLMGLDNEEAPNERVNLVGVDLLYMEPVQGCRFIQGDCLDPETWTKITALLPPEAQNKVEVVLSDMAPNISGNAIADAEAALEICESVLQFSKLHAQKGSTMLYVAIFLSPFLFFPLASVS